MILITGVPRSGTSMVAGIIDHCGGFGGKTSPPNPNNQKGMFENMNTRAMVKQYLRSIGADPLGQFPLPKINSLKPFYDLEERVMEIINREGWNGVDPIYYKGAKMALMWPLWTKAFPEAKWIIVRRPDEQIIASCMRTSFMKAFGDKKGWQWYIDYYKARMEEIKAVVLDRAFEVWSHEIVDDPKNAKPMIDWLGLEWKGPIVEGFVEPTLYSAGRNPERP